MPCLKCECNRFGFMSGNLEFSKKLNAVLQEIAIVSGISVRSSKKNVGG